MKGQQVLKHPDRDEITRMLNEGYTTDEVSKWLKQKHKHLMYHLSAITLNYYRQNFLKLNRELIAQKRKELLESGNVKDANVIEAFGAQTGFVEAREKATAEIINAIDNFKSIQEKIIDRLNLVERETKDSDGKAIYKPRNEEIIQGYLTRLESMTNSFVKLQESLQKKNTPTGSTEISITMNEMNKYSDLYKNIMQKTLLKLDPSVLNDFFAIFNEEKERMMAENGMAEPNKVNISINNNDTKVSITTNNPESPVSISSTTNGEYVDLDDENVEDVEENKPFAE